MQHRRRSAPTARSVPVVGPCRTSATLRVARGWSAVWQPPDVSTPRLRLLNSGRTGCIECRSTPQDRERRHWRTRRGHVSQIVGGERPQRTQTSGWFQASLRQRQFHGCAIHAPQCQRLDFWRGTCLSHDHRAPFAHGAWVESFTDRAAVAPALDPPYPCACTANLNFQASRAV